MSLTLNFCLLRNNIRSTCPVGSLKQHARYLSGKLFHPRSYEKQHFTTRAGTLETEFTEPQQTSEPDQPGTVLVFDIETTGYLHEKHKIVEIALRDLSGGKNCTFETLVNPERTIPESSTTVTGIDADLVCKPDIPRFSDVLPVLLAYIKSRQVPGKPVMWVAHNAKNFDVPFLAKEFRHCSAEIPADWIFVDSLSLARKLVKSEVQTGEKRRPVNLEALREHYGIRSEGTAHRAMRDVTVLSQILQKITSDLKLTYEGLRNESFVCSDCRKVS